jgi:hypothetical protein
VRDVRAGKVGVCAAASLLGSPPDDYHECAQCAVPDCFQCAAVRFSPEHGAATRETPGTPSRVAALIHLTPGNEQRALVRYALKFAQFSADGLVSLEPGDVSSQPEHQRALCELFGRLRSVV